MSNGCYYRRIFLFRINHDGDGECTMCCNYTEWEKNVNITQRVAKKSRRVPNGVCMSNKTQTKSKEKIRNDFFHTSAWRLNWKSLFFVIIILSFRTIRWPNRNSLSIERSSAETQWILWKENCYIHFVVILFSVVLFCLYSQLVAQYFIATFSISATRIRNDSGRRALVVWNQIETSVQNVVAKIPQWIRNRCWAFRILFERCSKTAVNRFEENNLFAVFFFELSIWLWAWSRLDVCLLRVCHRIKCPENNFVFPLKETNEFNMCGVGWDWGTHFFIIDI